MRAPKVVDFYTAAWPDFTPALTHGTVTQWKTIINSLILLKTS